MGLMFCVFLFGMDGTHGQAGDKVLQVSNKKEVQLIMVNTIICQVFRFGSGDLIGYDDDEPEGGPDYLQWGPRVGKFPKKVLSMKMSSNPFKIFQFSFLGFSLFQ